MSVVAPMDLPNLRKFTKNNVFLVTWYFALA